GTAHDAEYEKEKAAFFKIYSRGPARWYWNLLDARRAMMKPDNREQATKAAKDSLAEVIAAKNAPENLREQASVMNVKLDIFNHVPLTDLIKSVSEHIKAFPKSQMNAGLAQGVVVAATLGQSEEQAIASLRQLKADSTGQVAAAAATRMAELE